MGVGSTAVFLRAGIGHAAGSSGSRRSVPPTPSPTILGSALLVAALVVSSLEVPATAVGRASRCAGRATLTGTAARDVLRGTPGADVIDASAGDDVIWGLGGRDLVCGGGGNDLLYGGSAGDILVGDGGRDLLIGGSGGDRLAAGPGSDVCDGRAPGCEARDRQPRPPILAGFYYPWFPEAWDQGGIDPYTRFHPTLGRYDLDRARTRRAHVEMMRRSGMQAAIASWWGAGTPTDRRIRPMLRASRGTRLRWSVYHEGEGQGDPTPAEIADDLSRIGNRYGTDRNFLRIGGRFVVFVYAEASDGCEMADRWNGARRLGAFVVLKVFNGFESCSSQPDAWHQYAPAVAADAQPPHSYSISPGFWKADEASPRLGRSLDRWRTNVRRMMRADVTFRLVTTFNEWGEGTAVESAREWHSGSRLGRYLDALRDAARRG